MSTVNVYSRRINKATRTRIEKMLDAAEVTDYCIVDLDAEEPKKLNKIVITLGQVARRKLAPLVFPEEIFILPSHEELIRKKENKESRELAWETLQKVRKHQIQGTSRSNKGKDQDQKTWEWVELTMKDGRTICIYEGEKPDIKSDRFMSREDCQLLLALQEAFGAMEVTLGN